MKTIRPKSAVILFVIGLAVMYILGLAVSTDDFPPISIYNADLIPYYIVYLVCSAVIGLSAAWFLSKRDDSSGHPYRWGRLIPVWAVIMFLRLHKQVNMVVPTDWNGWLDVILLVVFIFCGIAAGILLTRIVLAWYDPSFPKWKVVLQAAAVIVILFIVYDIGYRWWYVERLCTFALPLVFWAIAEGFNHSKLSGSRYADLVRPLYFLTVSGLTAACVGWYNHTNIALDYNIVRLVCLIGSAVLALWIAEGMSFGTWFFRTPVKKFYKSPLFWTAGMTFGFFCTSDRFTYILSTWNAPVEPYISMPGVYDTLEFPNWFAYRWTVLSENLQGRLDSIEKMSIDQLPLWNSLTWLHYIFGILPVIAAVLLLAGAFIFLWKCAKKNDRLSRYLYTVLLLRTVLGLLANLLVVYSTDITPLMMGLMPWDLIFVIMILWTRQNGDNNAE